MMQLTCPKCKHEFQYNNGHLDAKIARIGIEISTISRHLAEYKAKKIYRNRSWLLKTKIELEQKKEEISKLKAFRKLADQQVHHHQYEAFKNAVRDILGEEAYQRCMERMYEETRAYAFSDMAKAPYSHKHGAEITSISKI